MDNWYMQAFIDNLPPTVNPSVRNFFDRQTSYGNLPPGQRSLLFDFICTHPNRGHLVVLCADEFIKESISVQPPINTIIPYCGDNLTRILVALFSQRLGSTLIAGDYFKALEMVGAQFVRCHEELVLQRPIDLDEPCPICFETLKLPTITNCCNYAFCASCLFQACQTSVSSRCPCCRGTISGQRLSVIAQRPVPEVPPHPCKLDSLVQELRARPNGQHIIYFPFENMYGSLRNALRAAELNFDVLLGGRQAVQRKLERFSRGSLDILILLNRQHILLARNQSTVNTVFIYPDSIFETDKIRLLSTSQWIGRTQPLEVVSFREHCQVQGPQ